DDEQRQEHAHRDQAEYADRVERDGPREKKRDLEIENDEEDRDEVVAHVEAVTGVLERFEAAFVRRQLLRILAPPTEREADEQQQSAEGAGHAQKYQDRQVICEHTFVLLACRRRSARDKKIGR